jgi:anti-sigma factor RsiW
MSGEVIKLHGDGHEEMELLLPWYVTGRLDAADTALVETHLAECPECAAEVRSERRLAMQVASLAADAGPGWARLHRRLQLETRRDGKRRPLFGRRTAPAVGRAVPRWVGWAIAAQSALLVIGAAVFQAPVEGALYHALGAAPADRSANAMVIFRPQTSERSLRLILRASHARLVDGPTAADAYVLHIPAAERTSQLTALRERPEIEVAEPIDSGVGS